VLGAREGEPLDSLCHTNKEVFGADVKPGGIVSQERLVESRPEHSTGGFGGKMGDFFFI